MTLVARPKTHNFRTEVREIASNPGIIMSRNTPRYPMLCPAKKQPAITALPITSKTRSRRGSAARLVRYPGKRNSRRQMAMQAPTNIA